jgi:hypothetical protein
LDFESPATGLQAPGVAFEGVEVIKGEVWSSPGVILRTAPSGTNAAFSGGAKVRFSLPVIKVSMLVSLSFISVPLARTNVYLTARLRAYGTSGELLGTTTAPVFAAVAEPELLENFTPTLISIATSVPMAQITIDLDEEFRPDGSTFFFDDLTLTVQEQQPLVRPTMTIESRGNRVFVWWSIPSAKLQQSPDLVSPTWQPVAVDRGYVFLDPKTNAAMFFRVVRPIQ